MTRVYVKEMQVRSDRVGFPYLRPGSNVVTPGAWTWVTDAGLEPLGEIVPGWDYSVDITLQRKIRVAPRDLAADCGLDSGTVLVIMVALTTGEQSVRRTCLCDEYVLDASEERMEVHLDVNLKGTDLQGHIDLVTLLTVRRASGHHPLAPTVPGARLWEDAFSAQLESGGGRLGMEAEDFMKASPEFGGAPWFFLVGRLDPWEDFGGNVRVVLNEARSDIVEAVQKRHRITLGFLAQDLVRHILTRVLRDPDFLEGSVQYDPESLGKTVEYWISAAFPGKNQAQVAAILDDQPELFDAAIASAFGVVDDG